jgi:hypothetical protein
MIGNIVDVIFPPFLLFSFSPKEQSDIEREVLAIVKE